MEELITLLWIPLSPAPCVGGFVSIRNGSTHTGSGLIVVNHDIIMLDHQAHASKGEMEKTCIIILMKQIRFYLPDNRIGLQDHERGGEPSYRGVNWTAHR